MMIASVIVLMTQYNFNDSMDGKQIKMTEDHKVTSCSERLRIEGIGEPLKDGETRLCGKCKFLHLVITVRIQQHHKIKVHHLHI